MQLKAGDRIILKKKIGPLTQVGREYIVDTLYPDAVGFRDETGNDIFCGAGYISLDEIEEYFYKKEIPKKTTVTAQDVDEILRDAKIVKYTLFEKCTIVAVKLKNGFVIVESSACVSPANYNIALGYEICMRKIKDRLMTYCGYMLQETNYKAGGEA